MLNKKTIATIAAAAVFIFNITACSPSEREASVEASKEIYIAEAYIDESLATHETGDGEEGHSIAPEVIPAYTDTTSNSSALEETQATAVPTAETRPEGEGAQQEVLTLVEAQYGDLTLYRINDSNWLTNDIRSNYDNTTALLTNTANRLKGIRSAHPELKIYSYYITRIGDCDWFGDSVQVYDYASFYASQLSGSGIAFDRFELPDFDYYKETGYKTDFHANYKGSDTIYGDVYDLFAADFTLSPRRQPVKEMDFENLYFVGDLLSADAYSAHSFTEDEMDIFKAYRYDVGPYTSYVDDQQMVLGLEEEYAAGQIQRDPHAGHQFIYYGGQTGVVRFEFNQPDKPNLLMVSDSQGRPSRVCIASHFNTTVYIDAKQWQNDDIDKLIEDYDIDAMLLIGQRSMLELPDVAGAP